MVYLGICSVDTSIDYWFTLRHTAQMPPTKIFKSGNSLAVRLQRDIAFEEGVEVVVSRKGDSLIIRPTRLSMTELAAALGAQPAPKMIERSEVKAPRLHVNKSGD